MSQESLTRPFPLYLLLVVAVLLAGFWLRTENLDRYPPGVSNDEAINAIDAVNILHNVGHFPLYPDKQRPEPLYRVVLAGTTALYGSTIWAYRLTSAFFGTLTLAAAYWAAAECLHDVRADVRRVAALAGAAALTVALGHITLSRAIYRAIPQPFFTFLFVGFLLRGLRTRRWRDMVLSGLSLAAAMYTYTAALVIPGAAAAVGLSLLIFRLRRWRFWLPRLIVVGGVTAILMLPVGIMFLQHPASAFSRAGDVSEGQGLSLDKAIGGIAPQFYKAADENPQYNVASAPLLPDGFLLLFVPGLVALALRIRQPSSALILALLVLGALPVLLADELTHNLRIIGEFTAIGLVVAAGMALVLQVLLYVRRLPRRAVIGTSAAALLLLTGRDAIVGRQVYADYWEHADRWLVWSVFGLKLTHNEWFFRTDRRAFAEWMVKQESPLLVPVDELANMNTRAWLLTKYPNVATTNDDFQLPNGTLLVVPWSMPTGDYMVDAKQFALLEGGQIILLPPFSEATRAGLMAGLDQAETLTSGNGPLSVLAEVLPVPSSVEIAYEPRTVTGRPLASFGHDEIWLTDWRGPDTLSGDLDTQTLTYTLDWQAQRHPGSIYDAYLQLLTQDYTKIAGDEHEIWRWLDPTSDWKADDIVPDHFSLDVPQRLEPGAYRLVSGLYVYADSPVDAVSSVDETANGIATIGWVKVPQRETPVPEADARPVDATLGDQFALRYASATMLDDTHVRIRLYWEGLVSRPKIDATVFVHLVDSAGALNGRQSDIRPWGGQYPTFIWDTGEMVMTEHIIDTDGTPPGELTVSAGMYTFPDFTRLAVIQNGEPTSDNIIQLGTLEEMIGSG